MDTASIFSLGGVVAHKYRLEREIGRGGMGIVYAATDLTLGRMVALKLLISADPLGGTRPPAATSREDTARFMREARATAALRGDHVAQVYEAGITPEGVPFLAMELLQGEDLDRYVARRGPLPFAEACDLLIQACVALTEAHQLGIVHRDLKPQNFFVLPARDASGPKLKVLDFGISKMTSEADLALTHTTTTMGSPRYMSPEQVRSSKYVDARADLWALGAVLFEALTGRPLFNESTASALHAQIIADHAIPLRHVRFDAPPELELVVLRCVEKDPARRYASAVELAQALAPFSSNQGREVAARLLAAHGFAVPPVAQVGGAVPYSAHTPGYAPTGHPLPSARVFPAPVLPVAPPRRSSIMTWVWLGVAVFCVICVLGAALSAIFLGAAVQHVDTAPEREPEPDGYEPAASAAATAPLAPPDPEAQDPEPSRPPRPRAAKPDGGRSSEKAAAEAAREAERAKTNERARDTFTATNIRQAAVSNGALHACRANQHLVDSDQYPPLGAAVGACLDVCNQAGETQIVQRIQRTQQRRASASR